MEMGPLLPELSQKNKMAYFLSEGIYCVVTGDIATNKPNERKKAQFL